MFTMIFIPMLPIMALIIQNLVTLNEVIMKKESILELERSVSKLQSPSYMESKWSYGHLLFYFNFKVQSSESVATFISNLQQERSEVAMKLFVTNNFEQKTFLLR